MHVHKNVKQLLILCLIILINRSTSITTKQYPNHNCKGEEYTEVITTSNECIVPDGSRFSSRFDCILLDSKQVFQASSFSQSTDCSGSSINTTISVNTCIQLDAKTSTFVDCSNGNKMLIHMGVLFTLAACCGYLFV